MFVDINEIFGDVRKAQRREERERICTKYEKGCGYLIQRVREENRVAYKEYVCKRFSGKCKINSSRRE